MSRRPLLTNDERIAIVRDRLNHTAGVDETELTKTWLHRFSVDCMDVLIGNFDTLTPDERDRIRRWRAFE